MSLLNITKDQLRATIRSIWQGERPDADDTRYSDLWLYSRIASVVVWRMLQTIDRGVNAIFPTTSFGVYLDNWLNWIGAPDGSGNGTFGRIIARGSTGTDCLTVTATGVTADLINEQLTDDSAGKTYAINESYAFAGAGSANLDLRAIDVGAATNLESGATMTFVSPPANVNAAATLVDDLDGGADRETDAEGRARLLSLLRNPPASGNVADWVATIEAVAPGVLTAYVWPQRQSYPYGYGMTDYCALQRGESGTNRHILTSDDIYDDIDTAIDENLPALLYRNSRQLTMTSVPVDVELTITLGSAATSDEKADWDAVSANPAGAAKTTVASHDAGGNTIVTTGSSTYPTLTNGLKAGDRFVVNGIECVCGSVTNATTFEAAYWPFSTAANALDGLNIYAGGGFVGHFEQTDSTSTTIPGTGIVEAVRVYMDGRGPNMSYSGAVSEIPGWDSDVLLDLLKSAVYVEGGGDITDVSIALPATDLSHADESGATALIYDLEEITIWQVYV